VARRLFTELESPATRANLLRLAVLWQHGGVYLDTDTITVKDLSLLREHQGFCGQEPVALPGELVGSLHPVRWAAAGLRLLARDVCARLPDGPDRFRRIEHLYAWAVNNAVLAACPENALLTDAFSVIAAMPAARQRRRFALGTHLLQRLTSNRSSRDMEVLPPAYFYPLGPEISVHWFRDDSARRLDDLLAPETHVVHWYSSVEERVGIRGIDEAWILAHRDSSAFARLAAPYLDGP
jgi:hypothetical protein